jgi:hypothetical protein
MRLLNPSPGEVLDRITILELKIAAAGKREINSTSFQAEKNELEEHLRQWDQTLKEMWPDKNVWYDIGQQRNALVAINSLLWEAEDLVRALPDEEMSKLAMLAKRIAKLNDGRAKAVQQIAKLYGVEEQEKIYGAKLGRTASGA